MLSRNMGHKHYAVWNDTTLTFPEGEWYKVGFSFPFSTSSCPFPEHNPTNQGINHGERKDFHGPNIPVFGDTVAHVIRERLGLL